MHYEHSGHGGAPGVASGRGGDNAASNFNCSDEDSKDNDPEYKNTRKYW